MFYPLQTNIEACDSGGVTDGEFGFVWNIWGLFTKLIFLYEFGNRIGCSGF